MELQAIVFVTHCACPDMQHMLQFKILAFSSGSFARCRSYANLAISWDAYSFTSDSSWLNKKWILRSRDIHLIFFPSSFNLSLSLCFCTSIFRSEAHETIHNIFLWRWPVSLLPMAVILSAENVHTKFRAFDYQSFVIARMYSMNQGSCSSHKVLFSWTDCSPVWFWPSMSGCK